MSTRYQRRSPQRRTAERVQSQIPPLEFGTPIPTFRAAITGDGTNLPVYTRQGVDQMGFDEVSWDYWQNGDSRFYEEVLDGAGLVSAVTLNVPGWYMIRATIDWDDFFTSDCREMIATNADESGTKIRPIKAAGVELTGPLTIDQFRFVWPANTGDEFVIQIFVGHSDTVSHTIPGGFSGAWAMPPMLYIGYLGGYSTDDFFFQDV